jgi:uncharacterized membrane protein
MSSFFATVFPNLSTAEEAQRLIEKFNDNQVLKLASSVVIVKGEDGEITQHHGRSPGALGAGLGGLVVRWLALSAQRFAADKWSLCRVVV